MLTSPVRIGTIVAVPCGNHPTRTYHASLTDVVACHIRTQPEEPTMCDYPETPTTETETVETDFDGMWDWSFHQRAVAEDDAQTPTTETVPVYAPLFESHTGDRDDRYVVALIVLGDVADDLWEGEETAASALASLIADADATYAELDARYEDEDEDGYYDDEYDELPAYDPYSYGDAAWARGPEPAAYYLD